MLLSTNYYCLPYTSRHALSNLRLFPSTNCYSMHICICIYTYIPKYTHSVHILLLIFVFLWLPVWHHSSFSSSPIAFHLCFCSHNIYFNLLTNFIYSAFKIYSSTKHFMTHYYQMGKIPTSNFWVFVLFYCGLFLPVLL